MKNRTLLNQANRAAAEIDRIGELALPVEDCPNKAKECLLDALKYSLKSASQIRARIDERNSKSFFSGLMMKPVSEAP